MVFGFSYLASGKKVRLNRVGGRVTCDQASDVGSEGGHDRRLVVARLG